MGVVASEKGRKTLLQAIQYKKEKGLLPPDLDKETVDRIAMSLGYDSFNDLFDQYHDSLPEGVVRTAQINENGKRRLLFALRHKRDTGEIPDDENHRELSLLAGAVGFNGFEDLYDKYKKTGLFVIKSKG